jgi:hypothetical protein
MRVSFYLCVDSAHARMWLPRCPPPFLFCLALQTSLTRSTCTPIGSTRPRRSTRMSPSARARTNRTMRRRLAGRDRRTTKQTTDGGRELASSTIGRHSRREQESRCLHGDIRCCRVRGVGLAEHQGTRHRDRAQPRRAQECAARTTIHVREYAMPSIHCLTHTFTSDILLYTIHRCTLVRSHSTRACTRRYLMLSSRALQNSRAGDCNAILNRVCVCHVAI